MPRKEELKSFKLYFSEEVETYGVWRYTGIFNSRMKKDEDPMLPKETNIVFYFKSQNRNHQLIKKVVNRLKDHFGCTHIVAAPSRTPQLNGLQKLFGSEVMVRTSPVAARKYTHSKPVTQDWKDSIQINWREINRDSVILLVDDIVTTGKSILALKELLSAKGNKVITLGLGINIKLIDQQKYEMIELETEKISIAPVMPAKELEAFELFYALGENRSLTRLVSQNPEKKFTRHLVSKWSVKYNWPKLVKERDQQVQKVVESKALLTLAEEKSEAIHKTNQYLQMVESVIQTGFERSQTGALIPRFEIENMQDLKMAVDVFEKLTKLKIGIYGEDIEKTDNRVINLQIVQNNNVIDERKIDLSKKIEPEDAEYTEEE